MVLPDNKLIDALKDEKKKFDELADKNRKNLFVAREASNTAFVNQLNGNEKTTVATGWNERGEITGTREGTLDKVQVLRGSVDDVIGVKILWQ